MAGPWENLRQSPNVEDRREDPWPWLVPNGVPTMTPSAVENVTSLGAALQGEQLPPITNLSKEMGVGDMKPIAPEELLKFLLTVDALNAEPKR